MTFCEPTPDTETNSGALIPRDSITEIVAARDAAVAFYEQFFDQLAEAHQVLKKAHEMVAAACDGKFTMPYVEQSVSEVEAFKRAIAPPDVETLRTVARRLTDIQVWGAVIAHTELESLMDKTAKDELRRQMAYVPERSNRHCERITNQEETARGIPPVTEEAILATLEDFADRSGEIWRRGIATAFSTLDRRFRSHDGFKIGTRVILTNAFNEWGSWSYFRNHRDTITDIERVFLILDGKKPTATYAGIVGRVDAERGNKLFGPRQSQHEGDYFEIRIFKNGNAHLWFRREDLVQKVNLLLAEHYGAALGWGTADQDEPEDLFANALERPPAKNFGSYPSPDKVADKVIDEAGLWSEKPLRILEPSAGTGQLATRAVKPHEDKARHRVTVVEIRPELASKLQQDGRYARVVCRDFLSMTPVPIYDRIIMNPPFDRGRDIEHVHHALGFLAPDGRLVSVMSAAAELSPTKKAEAFQKIIKSHRGRFQDLPEGSFEEVGTNVNTVILSLTKRAFTKESR